MTSTQDGKFVTGLDSQIATIDSILDNIHDTDLPAVAAEVTEVEHHLHGQNKVYGLTSGFMARESTVPLVVTGGNNAWGTSLLLHKGTMDGAYFDPDILYVTSVGNPNSPTLIEFYSATLGDSVNCTVEADDDVVSAASHGLADGDRFIFDTLNDETKGVTKSEVYYVRDAVANVSFKVAATSGGAAINVTGDLTGTIKKVTATLVSETIVSCAATNSDSFPWPVKFDRIASTKAFFCRAKSKSGDTTSVSFFIGVHTYAS